MKQQINTTFTFKHIVKVIVIFIVIVIVIVSQSTG